MYRQGQGPVHTRPGRAFRPEPVAISARPAGRDGRGPVGQDRRGRALPGRDRRLARLHPHAVRRAGARAVGTGRGGAPARIARNRGAVDLVGRRHRVPPARRGRASRDRRPAARPGRSRGPRRPGGRSERALRRALPRERGTGTADPEAQAGRAHAALAAAAQGAVAAPGRAPVPRVPDRARDVPRVPPRRLRPPVAEAAAPGTSNPRARPGRRRDGLCLAVCLEPALRLHRDVHVRGRHAAGRAARAGALARPRPAARAPRAGGAARPARSRRARRGRAFAADPSRGARTSCTTCSGSAETSGPASSTRRTRRSSRQSGVRSARASATTSA